MMEVVKRADASLDAGSMQGHFGQLCVEAFLAQPRELDRAALHWTLKLDEEPF